MSIAWYWPDWSPLECSDPPEESCSDAACPRHGTDDLPAEPDDDEAAS